MPQTIKPDVFFTSRERTALANTPDDTAVINTVRKERDNRTVVTEQFLGMVKGAKLAPPKGTIVRKTEHHEDKTTRIVCPSGGKKIELKEVAPNRADWDKFQKDHFPVRAL